MSDTFVQLQPDGPGKQVDMDLVGTTAGAPIYRQRAVMVGDTQEFLQQLLLLSMRQLAILRAINANLGGKVSEEDFIGTVQEN